jgi:hypothetical protein
MKGQCEYTNFLIENLFLRNNRLLQQMVYANKETYYTEYEILQITMLMDSAWQKIEKINLNRHLQKVRRSSGVFQIQLLLQYFYIR